MKKETEPSIKVPLLDLKAQYQKIAPEIRQALEEVLQSQQFILGKAVQRFEQEAASFLGSSHAIGVASGSDALLLSLMALGIGPGDAVIVPPFTFFSSVSCITRLGAAPLFVDIDPKTCLIDTGKLETLLEERCRPATDGRGLIETKGGRRIKAILPVHLFGQSCAMVQLLTVAERHRLHLVEDVAQAFGARADLSNGSSKCAGTIGDLGCFSFFPTKTLGGMGDGGLVAANKKDFAEKIRLLRHHGESSEYRHEAIGLNSRLDEVQAAVLSVKLRYLDQWIEGRIERAHFYQKLFEETGLSGREIVGLPTSAGGRNHVFNYYVIRVERRDALRRRLSQQGIQSAIYYPVPLHLQPCFAPLGYHAGDFPASEIVAKQAVALPIYPELLPEQQEHVVEAIRKFYRP
jgi:dTDP-4-amino-4,6-dideoxygalactose transaminase